AMPEMRKAGYDDGLTAGSVAAGGAIGILVPPSIILVIYGAIAEQSVPKLFAAALLPALILPPAYVGLPRITAHLNPKLAPIGEAVAWHERLRALRQPWQFVLLFTMTIGGIYGGIFSPTEAAALGAAGAILLGVLGRRLSTAQLFQAVEGAVI